MITYNKLSLDASHHEAKQTNGQNSALNAEPLFMFASKSYANAKKVFSVDASITKPTNINVASSTNSTHENTTTKKDLNVLHKEILSLYGSTNHAVKIPSTNVNDEKPAFPVASTTGTIGMEMFGNNVNNVKPSFSFNVTNNLAKPAEPGTYIKDKFNIFWKLKQKR